MQGRLAMALRYTVETEVDEKQGAIDQKVYLEFNDIREQLGRKLMRTMDAEVRKALIKLGWTPPKNLLP
jgi:hypothetical protein